MGIRKVGIVGLGALGTMYGAFMTLRMKDRALYIVADDKRITDYKENKIYCNGQVCDFNYATSKDISEPFDLIIFTVKFTALKEAIETARPYIGDHTIILSMLNGIVSEEIIQRQLGIGHILYCTVQGMDALKEGNRSVYTNMGYVAFGEKDGQYSDAVKQVKEFFDEIGLPYRIPENMVHQMWGKLLLNVGVNQAVAVYETNYGGIQREGKARECMIGAMQEALLVARAENIPMSDDEFQNWLELLDTLNPEGKPSLRQDTEAGRKTEVELFSGTIRELGKKHHILTPYNDYLYQKILELESKYL